VFCCVETLKLKLFPPQGFVGVTLGVTVLVTVGVTVFVGVTDGVIKISQSNTTLKLVKALDGVGVGVGILQDPTDHKLLFKLGQVVTHGDGPKTKQLPSNAVDKHHLVVSQ
jgi:hypothetical protein